MDQNLLDDKIVTVVCLTVLFIYLIQSGYWYTALELEMDGTMFMSGLYCILNDDTKTILCITVFKLVSNSTIVFIKFVF